MRPASPSFSVAVSNVDAWERCIRDNNLGTPENVANLAALRSYLADLRVGRKPTRSWRTLTRHLRKEWRHDTRIQLLEQYFQLRLSQITR